MGRYDDFLARGRAQWGEKFSEAGLNQEFVPYFNNGQRVKVRFTYASGSYEEKTGTIGVTTGWVPVFLLMLTRRSIGSSWTIGREAKVVAVQAVDRKGRYYRPVGSGR